MRTIDLPRKHHFNPRFYLDRWTGRDKQLCEMRLINGKIVPKRPDGVATAGHALFYEERGWSGRRESNPRMQLGKLDVSQSEPELSCKTPEFARQRDQWVRSPLQNIFQRDDGLFEIGLSDPRGPFESRRFAEAVANRDTGDPPDKRRRPRRANPRPFINRWDRAAATHTYAKAESLSSPALRRDPAVLAGWYAVTADSPVLGTFKTRREAAQASGAMS
jgi:hypothetical protein